MIKLPIIDKEQITKIHEGTMHLLSEIGIFLTHQEARNLLVDKGGVIKGDRVTIPTDFIEESISKIPSNISLQGRDADRIIRFGGGNCYPHNVGGVPNVLSTSTGTRRPASRADNIDATQILDALPNTASITPLYTPQDVPGSEMTLWMTYDTLLNTTKPFRSPGLQTSQEVKALVEMFQIACPEGNMTIGISPVSPLTFPDDTTSAILEVAKQGVILGPLPCPILGATSPMSIAGGVVQQNSEVLASICLAYLVRPGLPIIYKGRLSVMNPRSGLSVWGNPEIGIISAASVAMGHNYGIPVDVYGFCTNAHLLDIQNGYERAFNALVPVLAGADEISGIGEIDGGVSSSLAQIVIDNEIFSSIQKIKSGFEVSENSLGLDVISDVMEKSRNFLGEKHTIQYLRSGEVLSTRLAARDSWSQWEKDGREGIIDRAESAVQNILENHEVRPLEAGQIAEMNKVIANFSDE